MIEKVEEHYQMNKVFLVMDTDYEGPCLFVASTHTKAWCWIKKRQYDDWMEHCKRPDWGPEMSAGFREHYLDKNDFHPYTIDEMEIDEK